MLRPRADVETHLVISTAGRATIRYETGYTVQDVRRLADVAYGDNDLGAAISSGSFRTAGMLIAPTSVKTLSAVANSFGDHLIARAADVCLKERRRPVVLLLRETPLHAGHIRLMGECTNAGAIVMPPVPAFYALPQTLDDVIDHTVQRALDQFDLAPPETARWDGDRSTEGAAAR